MFQFKIVRESKSAQCHVYLRGGWGFERERRRRDGRLMGELKRKKEKKGGKTYIGRIIKIAIK